LAQTPALADVDPDDREAVAARGREEIERSATDPDLVRSRLGQLLRDLDRGEVRSASDAVIVQLPDGADLHLQLAPDGEHVVLS
jgi:hypothetical protein